MRMLGTNHGHCQGHKSNTAPNNKKTKLWLLLQKNSPKSIKATFGQSHIHVLVKNSDVDNNTEKTCE